MASSSQGGSKGQMSFGKSLDTISAACAAASLSGPQNSSGKSVHGKEDEKVEKRGLLFDIDLNVAPPEDDDSESPKNSGNEEQIAPTGMVAVAAEEKVISGHEHDLKFNGISDEVCREKSESGNGIQAHLSKGESNEFGLPEGQAKGTESEQEIEEKEKRNRRWNALLEVAEIASREYEENLRNDEAKVQNRRRGASREIQLGGGSGGGLRKATTRKKVAAHRGQSVGEERNGDGVVAAAAEGVEDVLAPPLVVRSTRSRAVAMPNKYRDSVLDGAVAEAEFHRHNKSGKSAAVVSTKRKSR